MKRHHTVTLVDAQGNQCEFVCEEGVAICTAAKLANISLTLGCMQGRCAICRAEKMSGELKFLRPIPNGDTSTIPGQPDVLLCSNTPLSDVCVKPRGRWVNKTTLSMSE